MLLWVSMRRNPPAHSQTSGKAAAPASLPFIHVPVERLCDLYHGVERARILVLSRNCNRYIRHYVLLLVDFFRVTRYIFNGGIRFAS